MSGWRWSTPSGNGRVSIGLVGDTNIQDRERPASAFDHVIDTLRGFDVLIGQWECPLTEAEPPEGAPDVTFKPGWRHSRPAMAEALTAAGFKAVSLASNVTYPPAVASETARHLERFGIGHAGAGRDRAEARAPAWIEASGMRIALLSYTSVFWPIEQPATATTPGVATIRAHTAYAPGRRALEMPGAAPEIHTWADPAELADMTQDVAAAARSADLVVVACHWGVSSQEEFVGYQQEIARAAIDAGARIVYGTHPHRIQAIEIYRRCPIFYSLGNFAFDWSKMRDRHLDGLLVRCVADRSEIVQTSFVPVRRGPNNNVQVLSPSSPEASTMIKRTEAVSRAVGTRFRVVGQEIIVFSRKEA